MKAGETKVQLSERQAQVLEILCAEGCQSKEIAARLDLAVHTVDGYIDQAIRVLKLGNRQRLVLWGLQHPGAMLLEWTEARIHPPGCPCQFDFCRILRSAKRQRAA